MRGEFCLSNYIIKLSNQVSEVVGFSEANPTQGTVLGYTQLRDVLVIKITSSY